ncbi:MAG: sigma-70 family RNA polymerase sigma factor [Terrimesophilobacter sp.]
MARGPASPDAPPRPDASPRAAEIRATDGWEGVVTNLVAQRGDALTRYAFLLCGSADDAADLVQDALVKTFGRLRNGFSVSSAEAYVRRAILNGYLDRGRRRTRFRKIVHLAATPDAEESLVGASGQRLDVREQLLKLSPRERSCVVLRYYEDLKVADIAQWLGISPGAVKRYLSDALGRMAIALNDGNDESATSFRSADTQGAPHAY